jgi:indolepyruvate ferredoxin oxidoreductase
MMRAFGLLAKLKGLRGTAFDVFGYTAERRMERGLIGWYEGIVAQLLERLPQQGPAGVAEIAMAPMDIRGYGPVKDKAVEQVKARVRELLARPMPPAANGWVRRVAGIALIRRGSVGDA